MTRTEFEQRVKDENLKMESYDIELDHYYDGYPHYMGCVQKNGKWVIYKTNERNGEAHIFKEYNSEDDAFEHYCLTTVNFWRVVNQLMKILKQ